MKIPKFEGKNLFEIKTYTDTQLGGIARNIPVLDTGERDPMRAEVFVGNTILHTTNGPLTLNFQIKATSLAEAIVNYDDALAKALEDMQTQQLRNKIITGGQAGRRPVNNNNNN